VSRRTTLSDGAGVGVDGGVEVGVDGARSTTLSDRAHRGTVDPITSRSAMLKLAMVAA